MVECENCWGCCEECEEILEFVDCLVVINCVLKIVKGGKCFGFVVLVVVGDQWGCVGFGKGKVKEVFEVICKVIEQVKCLLVCVLLCDGCMLYYDIEGCYGVGKVIMWIVVLGIGIIVGGLMCVVFEMLGVQDVVVKL